MGGDPPGQYATTVAAEPDGLEHLHDLIERARTDWPAIDGGEFDRIEMAVIELAGNVARHGRPSGTTEMTLRLTVDQAALRATLVDAGREFDVDLESAEMPDELDEHGRGIAMARLAVDELAYEHREGVNTWRMTRHLA